MAIRVKAGCVVQITYRLTDGDGRLLEERTPERPLEYVQGNGDLLPAVEAAIDGKTPGFRTEVSVSPRDGYGVYDPSLVVELPRSHFPSSPTPEVGMKFNTLDDKGKPLVVRVIEVSEEDVTIDGNHPLAGVELVFDLQILDVREAEDVEAKGSWSTDDDFGGENGGGTLH